MGRGWPADLEQLDNDALFSLGRRGTCAAAPGCPASEVRCGRSAVVSEKRIGTGEQEGLDSGRASVPDGSMQWCHAASGGRVGISARLDEIGNDIPLADRVPARRARGADYCRVQRLATPAVSVPNFGAARYQVSRHLGVVAEPPGLPAGAALADRAEAPGADALVAAPL